MYFQSWFSFIFTLLYKSIFVVFSGRSSHSILLLLLSLSETALSSAIILLVNNNLTPFVRQCYHFHLILSLKKRRENFLGQKIVILNTTQWTFFFRRHNIHLVFSTCQHKYKWILCTEKPVLNERDFLINKYKSSDLFWKKIFKG